MGRLCAVIVTAAAIFNTSVVTGENKVVVNGQHILEFNHGSAKHLSNKYLLFLPENYGKEKKRWPAILYLHGASVRGTNIQKVRRYGLPYKVDQEKDFPFVVISPQCIKGTKWTNANELIDLVDEVCSQYEIDSSRMYVTGVSMGGQGAWYIASQYPERFAAIAPLCGRADTSWALKLSKVPVWVFHGAKDKRCPIYYSERMVEALKALGGIIKFTVYPKEGHDIVTRTYENAELYNWFLQHRKENRIAPAAL